MSTVILAAEMREPYALNNPHAVFDLRRDEHYFIINYFLGRIRFVVDDFDLDLASPSTAVLGFAIRLKRVLNALADPGEDELGSYTNDQGIRLSRAQGSDSVVVEPLWREGSVEVPYDEILAAADRFLQDLLDELSVKFPQLTENPSYPAWRAL